MQFFRLLLVLWLCAFAYAQSPVGSSGSGDTGSTSGNGKSDTNGAASASSSGTSPSSTIPSSTMSTSTTSSTTSPTPSASKVANGVCILKPNLAVAGSFVALGVAAMM